MNFRTQKWESVVPRKRHLHEFPLTPVLEHTKTGTLHQKAKTRVTWTLVILLALQAEQTYQDAVEAGQSAFLLEESDETADVFQCRVGNLPPDTEATIR